jgi:hypothetical protein
MNHGRIANKVHDSWRESCDEVFVRYLLDELPEADRNRFEDEYLANDAVHEQLLAVEYELIDAYLRGGLSRTERRDFENRYSNTVAGRQKLANARVIANLGVAPPIEVRAGRAIWSRSRDHLAGLRFQMPLWIFGTVAATASVLLLTWLIFQARHAPGPAAVARSNAAPEAVPPVSLGPPPTPPGPGRAARVQPKPASPAQSRPAQLTPPPSPADDVSVGLAFAGLRATADRLKNNYEAVHQVSMAEVQDIIRAGRCQNLRVEGLLNRASDSLNAWTSAETRYWAARDDSESRRVDNQMKDLAMVESNADIFAAQMESYKAYREELLRRKASLEKVSRPTPEIVRQLNSLVADIDRSTARISEAQESYAYLKSRADRLKTAPTIRLGDIQQSRQRVEAYALQMQEFYKHQLAEAQAVCNR